MIEADWVQDGWTDLSRRIRARIVNAPDCAPGYYNNEGKEPGPAAALAVGYLLGASASFTCLDGRTTSGKFEGLRIA